MTRRWEHFAHEADIGVRGIGDNKAEAFAQVALANRQIITHLSRGVFTRVLPEANLILLYDVSHNTCKVEHHEIDGRKCKLFVHRKGATRAFGPGHKDIPGAYKDVSAVVDAADEAGLAHKVARLEPLICIKG